MTRPFLRPIGALLAAISLGACDNPPDDSPQRAIEERLVGTWLREYTDGGVSVRRVLVLQADGRFRESSVAGDARAPVDASTHEGEWTYDGTNLKRRYLLVNGDKPAAPMVPFATFELRFASPDEFTGLDRVRKREVVYRRVGDGTVP
jgi:hypothetical protein